MSAESCTDVTLGFWAPTGSALPKSCPASGFYCPGAEADQETHGAEPLIVTVGATTEVKTELVEQVVVESEQVSSSMEIDADIETFNETAFRYQLAAMYGVPVEWIDLDISAGSLMANFVITIPTSATTVPSDRDGSSNATNTTIASSISAASLMSQITTITPQTMAAALGVKATITTGKHPHAHSTACEPPC